jgi:hypothetical protein
MFNFTKKGSQERVGKCPLNINTKQNLMMFTTVTQLLNNCDAVVSQLRQDVNSTNYCFSDRRSSSCFRKYWKQFEKILDLAWCLFNSHIYREWISNLFFD